MKTRLSNSIRQTPHSDMREYAIRPWNASQLGENSIWLLLLDGWMADERWQIWFWMPGHQPELHMPLTQSRHRPVCVWPHTHRERTEPGRLWRVQCIVTRSKHRQKSLFHNFAIHRRISHPSRGHRDVVHLLATPSVASIYKIHWAFNVLCLFIVESPHRQW